MRKIDLSKLLDGRTDVPPTRRAHGLRHGDGPARPTRFQDTVRRTANAPRRRAY